MKFIIESPTMMRLEGLVPSLHSIHFSYTDKKLDFELQKLKHSNWAMNKMGPEAWQEEIDRLKAARHKTLLFEDSRGYWTYPGLAIKLSGLLHATVESKVSYPEPQTVPWAEKPFEMWPFQKSVVESLIASKHAGVSVGCHRKGERVLMFDGSLKAVEDVKVGDQLMGPDSSPRTVQELKRGQDTMYRLETINGQVMIVNGNHLLALRQTCRYGKYKVAKKRQSSFRGANPIVYITVEDYLKKSKKFKHLNKMFSVGVLFPEREVPLDPYFLGVMLGDGSWLGTPNVTTMDEEIVQVVEKICRDFNLRVGKSSKEGNKASTYRLAFPTADRSHPNPLTQILRDIGVYGTECSKKAIPQLYLVNSRQIRLELLAGLIDTDGSLTGGCFDYISKSKALSEGVAFLARSVGLRATETVCQKQDQHGTVGTYYRVCLSGHTDCVPTRLPRKKAAPRKQIKDATSFGFKVQKIADLEDYYGFVLDSDHLYLTDSFLVTHNTGLGKTNCLTYLVKHYGLQSVVMVPSASIAGQIYKGFVKAFGKKYVGMYGDGKKSCDKLFTVAVSQSLTKVEKGSEAWKFFSKTQVYVSDESHSTPSTTFEHICHGVLKSVPYRFFFSATQMRNDGLGLMLDAITGPIVYNMTVKQGIEQGYLAKQTISMVKIPSDTGYDSKDANEITRRHLYYSKSVNKKAGQLANHFVENVGQVLILIDEFEQLSYLLPHLRHKVGFAHGGVNKENKDKIPVAFHASDPEALVDQFNAGNLPILVGTSCISTGTDVQGNKATIYLVGGKSEIAVFQGAVGRSTRKSKLLGKDACHIVDFWPTGNQTIERHAKARKSIYEQVTSVRIIEG